MKRLAYLRQRYEVIYHHKLGWLIPMPEEKVFNIYEVEHYRKLQGLSGLTNWDYAKLVSMWKKCDRRTAYEMLKGTTYGRRAAE